MMTSNNHVFSGLLQDTAVSRLQPLYLIDANNIRITARDGETLLSITNEKGPKELTLVNDSNTKTLITGTIIGNCVLGKYLVLFMHYGEHLDSILKIDMSYDNPRLSILYSGDLGFDINYPIEAISDYENTNIQKVYWTDGKNLPRVIDITKSFEYYLNKSFDFVPELLLKETVRIKKNTGTNGRFHSGVILYAFTYYNKYRQESNIFYTSPILYISHWERGASPEEIVSNSFTIIIENVDTNFDYLRIYSIHRTSLDAVPTCKRVLDIPLSTALGRNITYTDTGTNGDIIDPSSLLYIGGEDITAGTICCKDGTLFLGNLSITRPNISSIEGFTSDINTSNVTTINKAVPLTKVSSSIYEYNTGINTLSAGFKRGEYYRLGFLALYKNGKWSEPIVIGDYKVSDNVLPSITEGELDNIVLNKIAILYTLPLSKANMLLLAGYKKIRPLVVFPEMQDRTILCLGVVNPTMYTLPNRNSGSLYALSSWFFRPTPSMSMFSDTGTRSPYSGDSNTSIPYTSNSLTYNPSNIRQVEILGYFKNSYNSSSDNHEFKIDWDILTLHSPDIELDDLLLLSSFLGTKKRNVGSIIFKRTLSDINIQTSTPTISSMGTGFVHKTFTADGSRGIVSGLFYEDSLVDDYENGTKFRVLEENKSPVGWMVYPWQRNGSLNNDVNRSASTGIRSAMLSKKIISNLRIADTNWGVSNNYWGLDVTPLVYSSDVCSIVKLGDNIYLGNIDTMLSPVIESSLYFATGSNYSDRSWGLFDFKSNYWWRTSKEINTVGVFKHSSNNYWLLCDNPIKVGESVESLAIHKEGVRMRYKSSPHLVLNTKGASMYTWSQHRDALPIIEICRDYNSKTAFGGLTNDALLANKWLPAGYSLILYDRDVSIKFEFGDTWYSRYDCLKTYPFTTEDPNLIVEIGSFMLESRVNIDGRYDRNRGQVNNTFMSPVNFNLINPVYSLKDNFFTYFILDPDFYSIQKFPNLITWSLLKSPSQEVDNWTNITLASTFNLDGKAGGVLSLTAWQDNIYCFLDNLVNLILFNSRVQIPTSDGVPIEISNNYKVDGKRCISEGVGCKNKFTICPTPNFLYYIDSVSGHLQAISSQGLVDLSLLKNMTTWISKYSTEQWTPNNYTFKIFYDLSNKDLYLVTLDSALCYNEILGEFVSFMPYEDIPVMFNIVDKFYCIKDNYINEMFAGTYNYFFGNYRGFDFTFVSNGSHTEKGDLSTLDKTFSTMDFRADKWSNLLDNTLSQESPFDYVRVWNEYQDTGEVLLKYQPNKPSILKKKFRVWRLLFPRDAHNRISRIRNPWCKIKLGAAPRYNNGNTGFVLFHDIGIQYII